MSDYCFFCGDLDVQPNDGIPISASNYKCNVCGPVLLYEDAAEDFEGANFSKEEKLAISITLRNEWERNGQKRTIKELTITDLRKIASQYRPLEPIEKMDQALINIEKQSTHVGAAIRLLYYFDYTYFHCFSAKELDSIFNLLSQENLIKLQATAHDATVAISAQGYQRLSEIQKPNRDSTQCFVAMWFIPEMNGKVYEKAIKPAIEFIEEGETESKYKAVKIDNVDHVNDINDEIIAQIRRSRFMVCDLTGYRGGVYFEAGLAYGLGLDVIYTCREDWVKDENLKDREGKEVKILLDSSGKEINIKKEGVHFDLAHRNRIEWDPNKLGEFKTKLENRIKAVIF